jgi:hypothetical protein
LRTKLFTSVVLSIFLLLALTGCGGKLSNAGFARVTDVSPSGAIRMQYGNGELAWKRVNPDNVGKDTVTALKNRNRPAKFVETKNGSTLTFLDGETIVYQDLN